MWFESVFVMAVAASTPTPDAFTQLYTTPYFHTLGVAAGLPSSRVYKTVQDRDGYLWIGTHDGLARYDGSAFRVYRQDSRDPGSPGRQRGQCALRGPATTACGAAARTPASTCFDTRREHFVHYRHDPKAAASLGGDDVWTVTQDSAGAIWVGSYAGGLDRLLQDTNTFIHFRHDEKNPQSLASDNILVAAPARAGGLWVGSDVGLDLLGSDGNAQHVDFSALPGTGRVNAIAVLDAGEGSVIVGTRRGLARVGSDLKAVSAIADATLGGQILCTPSPHRVKSPANCGSARGVA